MRGIAWIVFLGSVVGCSDREIVDPGGGDDDPSEPARDFVLGEGMDLTRPRVVATVPPTQGTEVELGSTVEVKFSADLRPDTIDVDTFTLTRDGETIAGAVEYDVSTKTARFRPLTPLERSATYTATVGADITDLDHVRMGTPYAWTFTAAPRGWDVAKRLETNVGPGFTTALGSDGVTHVVFKRGDALWAMRHDPGLGWTSAEVFASEPRPCGEVQLRTGSEGRVAVVYPRHNGSSGLELVAARFVPGAGWSAAVRFDHSREHADSPDAAIGHDGAINFVWRQTDDDPNDMTVWTRRWLVDGSWEAPIALEDTRGTAEDPIWPSDPRVIVDREGTVFAFWSDVGTWSRSRSASGAWRVPTHLAPHGDGRIDIVVDTGGAVTVVAPSSAWSAQYAHGAWSSAPLLPVGDGYAYTALAADPAGGMTAAWKSYDNAGPDLVVSTHRMPDGDWDAPTVLADDSRLSGDPVSIGSDASGTRFLAWQRRPTPYRSDVLFRRFVPSLGWTTTTPIEGDLDIDSYSGRVVVTPDGHATAFWAVRTGDVYDLWMSEYR